MTKRAIYSTTPMMGHDKDLAYRSIRNSGQWLRMYSKRNVVHRLLAVLRVKVRAAVHAQETQHGYDFLTSL